MPAGSEIPDAERIEQSLAEALEASFDQRGPGRTASVAQIRFALVIVPALFGLVSVASLGVGGLLGIDVLSFIGSLLPASTFVPLPADSIVLFYSASLSPVTIGIVGGLVAAVAALAERVFVGGIIATGKIHKIERFIVGNKFADFAGRHMFISLLVGGASFIPFEPFRFLAISMNYPRARYAAAAAIGRGSRYCALAYVGDWLLGIEGAFGGVLIVTLAVFAIGGIRSYLKDGTRSAAPA